jgi:hypothetical protein
MEPSTFTILLLFAIFAFIYFLTSSNQLRYSIIKSDEKRNNYAQRTVFPIPSNRASVVFKSMFDDPSLL